MRHGQSRNVSEKMAASRDPRKKRSKPLDMNIVLQLVLSEKWRGSEFSDAVGKQRISFPVTSAVCWYQLYLFV